MYNASSVKNLFLIAATSLFFFCGFFVQNTFATTITSYPILESISITHPADNLTFNVDGTLDITGLEVTGVYVLDDFGDKNSKVETITLDNITGFNPEVPITGQVLTITLNGITTTYTVDIVQSYPYLESINITHPADKLIFNVGDTLDITGLEVTGVYILDEFGDKNSKVETITSDNIIGFDSSVEVKGQILTVIVDDQATTYTIDVIQTYPILESINITHVADKLTFNVGDTLDITGLEVTGVYILDEFGDKNSKVETIGLSDVTGFDSSVAVTGQVLTITFGKKTTTYTVDVIVPTKPVTGVTLNETNHSLYIGGTTQLIATILPADATNKDVTWSSDTSSVATVDATGKVTAIALGSTIITVTTVDGGFTATDAITVITSGGSSSSSSSGGGGAAAVMAIIYKTGDINKDGSVNEYDFAILMDEWGQTGSLSADINDDGLVDEYDFAILMDNWEL